MFPTFAFPSLIIELCLSTMGIALGVILIFRARDNRLMLLWGVFTAVIMFLTMQVNVDLLFMGNHAAEDRLTTLLRTGLLVKTLFGAIFATLFPIISLRPELLTLRRVLALFIPFLFVLVVVRCFYWFDGTPTPLHAARDIITHIDHPDVQMRLMILVLTVFVVLYNLSIPFTYKWMSLRRKISRGMHFYAASILLILTLYVLSVVTADILFFYIYTYTFLLVPIIIASIYLVNENPLSLPLPDSQVDERADKEEKSHRLIDPAVLQLYDKMEHLMAAETPYVDPSYSIGHLSDKLQVSESMIIRTLRERGFSGYSEYFNLLRLQHFKVLAAKLPGLSVKELMYGSGFTSRSSFYRLFAQQENMSPGEYIEKNI